MKYTGSHIPGHKNSKMIIRRGNKSSLITKPEYQKTMDAMIQQFSGEKIEEPCKLKYTFFISDNRRRDLDNIVCTVNDCLVKAGVIPDDSVKWIYGFSVEIKKCEKGAEGVEILLTD